MNGTLRGWSLILAAGGTAMIAAVTLSGCAQGPDYERPDLSVTPPTQYVAAEAATEATGRPPAAVPLDSTAVPDSWWMAFEDTVLNRLVEASLRTNFDLAEAAGRVLEAKALRGGAEAARWPFVEIGAGASRAQSNFNSPFGESSFTTNQYSAVATLRWEVDLWGRLSRAEQAAYATLLATEADRRAVAQTLVATVVRTWLEIRELEAQLALTLRTTKNFEDNLVVVRDRYLRGLVPSLDLRLARQNLANAYAKRPQDEQILNDARRRLEILVGRYPAGIITASAPGYDPSRMPDPLPEVPPGLPSTLLERRPDLLAAEMRLASATMRIGEAKALLFPRLDLTAEGGTASSEIPELLTSATSIWSLAARLAMPLINRGQQKAQIRAAEARTVQAVASYRGTVLNAFREVEAALDAERFQRERVEQLRISVQEARRSLALAEDRYRRGLDNLLLTLDSQRRLFEAESGLLISERIQREARVALIQALGGSWDIEAESVVAAGTSPTTSHASDPVSDPEPKEDSDG